MTSTLADLIAPISVAELMTEYRDRAWFISRKPQRAFEELFSWAELESFLYIARPWERPRHAQTQLRLVADGKVITRAACLEDVMAALSGGATLNLNHVETQWLALRDLCDALIEELAVPVSANIFCTPPGGAGFSTHFDNQDVFVLQVEGHKDWRIHPRVIALPFPLQHGDAIDDIPPSEPVGEAAELRLKPGDVLYLPRGTPHDAAASDEASLHVTISASWPTWADYLGAALLELALDVPEVRSSLTSTLPGALVDLVAAIPNRYLDRARERLKAKPVGARPGTSRPILARDIVFETRLTLRKGLAISYRLQPHRVVLRAGSRDYPLPRRVVPYLEYICREQEFTVVDLPDELPGDSKLSFARWLMSRGLVEPAFPPSTHSHRKAPT